eukprot:8257983-Alexandrium_andersonii.AAC.1
MTRRSMLQRSGIWARMRARRARRTGKDHDGQRRISRPSLRHTNKMSLFFVHRNMCQLTIIMLRMTGPARPTRNAAAERR